MVADLLQQEQLKESGGAQQKLAARYGHLKTCSLQQPSAFKSAYWTL